MGVVARPTTPSDGFATSFGARRPRLDISTRLAQSASIVN
jgi:hypothetical protein